MISSAGSAANSDAGSPAARTAGGSTRDAQSSSSVTPQVVASGTVNYFDGNPVEGVIVNLRQQAASGDIRYLPADPTGATGRYQVFGAQPGPFAVQVTDVAPGLLTAEAGATLGAAAAVVDLPFPPHGVVLVRTDSYG